MRSACKTIGVVFVYAVCACWLVTGGVVAGEKKLRSMKYTPRTKQQAVAWQRALRPRLFRLLRMDDLVARKTPIPFGPKIVSSKREKGYLLQEVEINSTPTRRMKIMLTVPTDLEGRLPAVVCIAGHGGTRRSCYDSDDYYRRFARVLAESGYVTISTDVGQHKIHEKGRALMGERLWDLMRCVDFLASLDRVDSRRIGCAGLSLGGEMAMWLGAMDERVRATVSAGFLTKMDQMEQDHCMCWKFPGLRELVDYADIYSLTAPRALLCQNGLKEPASQFPVPLAREALAEIELIYADFGQPENVALAVHEGGHVVDLPSLSAFLENHLGNRESTVRPNAPKGVDAPHR
ncbi:MAG: acetylxylan esterase [Pirellulales bacterium]|nr:acetylxylan esterase [Pirellulales bacterium]